MAASSPSSVAAGLPDDDDEVVAELDVYLSKALADKLYLVQYPEKSADGYRRGGECIAARVKPGQRRSSWTSPSTTTSRAATRRRHQGQICL
ncbi:hypothetical protein HPB52_009470 [Rhipicephalus sanguineus]|uniref:Uncharacterized protein n=1 Tax=Rhipicephalus sanguineus TaxID=34632 RepID=A0A9D4PK69_RHISA|nr:hypothetical protein HPB52_009470 [Rhipicephalus sanguineus]